ncbi:ferroxidase, multicopper oxidase [Marasmius crinis-equi]|uniref:laccase n=1 Tax=Marasmius crinis-equi TaxID=585013 RepID=A0ABR3FQN7_9AGAR
MKGETLSINVIDELTESSMFNSTSIHWHGIFQKGSAWADGTVSVSQCPISSGHSFKYEMQTGNRPGTFWYHSHLSTQYCDGLRGAMVIYDPQDPHAGLYDVDDESTIITLSDCLSRNCRIIRLVNADKPAIEYPIGGMISNSTLINGLGRYKGGPAAPLAVINVEAGKRIDGHPMTIIEVDGTNHEPLEVNSLTIFAGIRANPSAPAGQPGFEGGANKAILRYKGAPETEPSADLELPEKPLKETDLRPLDQDGVPGEPRVDGADVNLNLAIHFDTSAGRYQVNGVPFVAPTVPVLLQILSGAKSPESLLPQGSVYSLPLNKTIQISMPLIDNIGAPHPMHLHGHNFHVVRSAGSSEYNFVNPVIRDVVSIGASTSDNVTIRFRTDNAGPWLLHCHIEQHLGVGLAVVLAEGFTDITTANPVPEDWKQLCPN